MAVAVEKFEAGSLCSHPDLVGFVVSLHILFTAITESSRERCFGVPRINHSTTKHPESYSTERKENETEEDLQNQIDHVVS
jgi:hypothetical protein